MRLCTFNVHMWTDAAGRPNWRAVRDVLAELRCDVIALNEVPSGGRRLADLARALRLHHAFADAGGIGNALLSRRPMRNVQAFSLGARSALVASFGAIDVVSTHLDPLRESVRLAQIDELTRSLASRAAGHLIAGDLNALRLSDYRAAALREVRAMRKLSSIEAPRGDVIAHLDRAGYVDCFRLARAGTLAGYRRRLAGALPDDELATCWAGTRIDFIWASPAALARVAPRRCWRIEDDASDHFPVVADFGPPGASPHGSRGRAAKLSARGPSRSGLK